MPKRSLRQRKSSPEAYSARHVAVTALAALAMLGAVAGGIRLGNSAIGDINPVHFRGAPVHPRDRGAAVPEPLPRPRAPAYASLYGWDEGRAAREAACVNCGPDRAVDLRGFDAGGVESAPRAPVRSAPEPVRVTIHHGKDGVERYSYQLRDVYLDEPTYAPPRARRRRAARDSGSGMDDADLCRRSGRERACRGDVVGARQRDSHAAEWTRDRFGEDADVDFRVRSRQRERLGESVIME